MPVAFAVAEKLGGVSGRELIAAIAAGTDVMTRISQSTGKPYWTMSEGWITTQLLGFIASAATAGRVLRLEKIVGGLGLDFPLLDRHEFKVWPASSYTSATNTATPSLRDQFGLRPKDVETITIVGGNDGTRLLCEPLELKRRPQVSIDGKYSILFTTAVMMVKGNVTLRDYTDEGRQDPSNCKFKTRGWLRHSPGHSSA